MSTPLLPILRANARSPCQIAPHLHWLRASQARDRLLPIGGDGMSETAETFKKAPKRKPSKGKSIAVSPEMREAYAEMIRQRAEKEEAYGRHLPQDEPRRR